MLFARSFGFVYTPRVIRRLFLLALLAGALTGCTEERLHVPEGWVHPDCESQAWVELIPLDIWGRSIAVNATGPGIGGPTPLDPAGKGTITWDVAAESYVSSTVSVTWSGEIAAGSLAVSATGGARTAISLDVQSVDGVGCAVFGLFVGLDHPYYAAGARPPRAGNQVDFLMNGEEFWAAVATDLADPDRPVVRVHQSTWWWESDAELRRPLSSHASLSPEARYQNTVMGLLEARGGEHRVLVARFAAKTAPGLAYQNNDQALRDKATAQDDDFEVILQGNHSMVELPGHYGVPARPFSFVARVRKNAAHAWRTFYDEPAATRQGALIAVEAGSFHQKAIAIDGDLAYVSGMNAKGNDWDTSAYRVFEPRRMDFDATPEERQAVADKASLADNPPRKDYGVRLLGPVARDVDELLKERWDYSRATGALYAEHTSPYELLERAAPMGEVTVQLVATMPEPVAERSILETHAKASGQATDLIFIEDQYWRAPLINEVLLAAMESNPLLRLVVITQPIPDAHAAKKYTWESHHAFASAFPDRYLLLQLKSFDRDLAGSPRFVPIFVHSKLHIVDDTYLSVGSCNKNNRGYLFEGELNVAIVDVPWVTAAKERVLANLVGPAIATSIVGKDGATVLAVLKELAESNGQIEASLTADPSAALTPEGLVYPLDFDATYTIDVGPDLW